MQCELYQANNAVVKVVQWPLKTGKLLA